MIPIKYYNLLSVELENSNVVIKVFGEAMIKMSKVKVIVIGQLA